MIVSLNNETVKNHAKLRQKKHRHQQERFLIEGEHLVEEAQKRKLLVAVYTLEEDDRFPEATLVNEAVMKKLTDAKSPPKLVGVCRFQTSESFGRRVLFLEHVQDPGNIGTLLRSALAFSFDTVVLDRCADLYSPKVLRATQGALFDLNVHFLSLEAFQARCPSHTLIASSPSGTSPKTKPTPPYALMLGNEGSGLSKQALKAAQSTLHVPTSGVESLNVAVAGSILMHRLNEEDPFFRR